MWIDAICINQQDLGERAQQVQLMGSIYTGAARVVVWLGPEEDDSTRALELVEWFAKHLSVDWKTQVMTTTPSAECPADLIDTRQSLILNDRGPSLAKLLARPWFRRVWIRQEIFLANQRAAVVQCGHMVIPWVSLKDVAFFFDNTLVFFYPDVDKDSELNGQVFPHVHRARQLGREEPSTLFSAMTDAVLSQCTDPKDRIFGVLSMIRDDERQALGIVPDYTKTIRTVYTELALTCLEKKGDLEFLTYGGLHDPARFTGGITFPTWVPDWTSRCKGIKTHLPNAGGNLSHDARKVGSRTLRMSAVLVSRLDKVFSPRKQHASLHSVYQDMRFTFTTCQKEGHAHAGDDGLVDAITRAWFRNDFADRMSPVGSTSKRMLFCEGRALILKNIVQDLGPHHKMLDSESRALQVFTSPLQKGLFALSHDGYIASVPRTAEVGDVFCVLPGCAAPLLLRPTAPEDQVADRNRETYQIVGEAYLDGFMDGEALFGRLPQGHRAVWRRTTKDDHQAPAFMEDSSSNLVWDDPRLRSMGLLQRSATWEEARKHQMTLTPTVLRQHGVPLVEIDLV
jgi:hypothetical protein